MFQSCCFYAAYFLRGIAIVKCDFRGPDSSQSGGHNAKDCDFTITDTGFDGFVDFEDCWFTGPVVVRNSTFRVGTNLLGNMETPVNVSFDFLPAISDTVGDLNINTYTQPGT
jgi:hypothetical protein